MDHRKTFALLILLAGIAIAGCISLGGSPAPTGPKIVALVGTPTPIPTDPPVIVEPTWVPTPTPIPPAMSLSDFTLNVIINGDSRPWTQDPSQAQPINAQYATRMDTAAFTVTNTGTETRKNVVITYDIGTDVSTTDSQGRSISTTVHNNAQSNLGTMNPGDTKDVNINSPYFGAMLTANLTITASWDGGSLVMYTAELDPTFQSGTVYTPANSLAVRMEGSYS